MREIMEVPLLCFVDSSQRQIEDNFYQVSLKATGANNKTRKKQAKGIILPASGLQALDELLDLPDLNVLIDGICGG